VGEGLLDSAPKIIRGVCPASAYAIITDATVAPLYGQALADRLRASLVSFPAGEASKSRHTWSLLTDQLLDAGIGRDGAILAVGGGVVGDLAGFVAATYLRGIPYVQVPTTLLAMIDSSIGGKTGVDTAHGKNLVGAFHQPRAVIADVTTLSTLPENHLLAGMAEAIKHGAVADAAYFEHLVSQHQAILSRRSEALMQVVHRSVEIKAAVVEKDVREQGPRAVLNFGHTVGHAIEAASDYRLLHGEAVAVGMISEGEIGTRVGTTDRDAVPRLRAALEAYGLPLAPPLAVRGSALLEAMMSDKKKRGGTPRFTLLRRLGQAAQGEHGAWTFSVDEGTVADVLNSWP
jgi:3-dehydroquinate synthase